VLTATGTVGCHQNEGDDRMKLRSLAYAGAALGVVALTSSFAEPMAFAKNAGAQTTLATAGCQQAGQVIVGDLFVTYTYSGFPGAARGVEFLVGTTQATDAAKGGSGTMVQAFNQSVAGVQVHWGVVHVELVDQAGKVIPGSEVAANGGATVTC
jgi:hypothetical protein